MLLSATSELISREILLSGLALNHTFHGLSAGTEYNISVTAATDAGLGTQATITATTQHSPESAISAPGMLQICIHSYVLYLTILQYILPTPLTHALIYSTYSMHSMCVTHTHNMLLNTTSLPHIAPGHVTDLLASEISTTALTVAWNPPTLYREAITVYKVCVHVCPCTYKPTIYVCVQLLR